MKKKKYKPVKKKRTPVPTLNLKGVYLPKNVPATAPAANQSAELTRMNFIVTFVLSAVLVGAYGAWWTYTNAADDTAHFAHQGKNLTPKGMQDLLVFSGIAAVISGLVAGCIGCLNYWLMAKIRLKKFFGSKKF